MSFCKCLGVVQVVLASSSRFAPNWTIPQAIQDSRPEEIGGS
jgi:hypothetical protein